MYFRCNAGGWNKTHEQVERTPRIDSFELAFTHAWGGLFCGGEYLDIYQEDSFCEIFPPSEYKINLSHKRNGYGGRQTFFLCPGCGGRVRFLYLDRAAGVLMSEVRPAELQKPAADKGRNGGLLEGDGTVSYTHLTLPTIA